MGYFMKRVFGPTGTCYLTRFKLCPMTPWGQLYIHFFHRGDYDRSFHDHPYDFWTFPLRTYYERVLDLKTGRDVLNAVIAWRWHFRPGEYTHIQMGSATYEWDEDSNYYKGLGYNGPTITLLWRKHTRRRWGFWTRNYDMTFDYTWEYHKDHNHVAR